MNIFYDIKEVIPSIVYRIAIRRSFWLVWFLGLAVIATPALVAPVAASGPIISGCTVFPSNNIWNVPIDNLPVHPRSRAYIESIGTNDYVNPGFGSGTWEGALMGFPINIVSGTQPKVPVNFYYDAESDPGPYPIPPNAQIEDGPNSVGDRHVLVLDKDHCILYELFDAWPQAGGSYWQAGSGAIFNLASHALRPEEWTSADAAGLPILPGLIRYEETAGGAINHAIRFAAPRTQKSHVWPARHHASDLTGEQYPPMGQHFRLKANVDISGFSPIARTILTAMKKYGIILADNGSAWYLSGVPDERWDNDVLRELRGIFGRDFEAVDVSSLMVDPDSGETITSDSHSCLPFIPLLLE